MFNFFGGDRTDKKASEIFNTIENDLAWVGVGRDLLATHMSYMVNNVTVDDRNELVLAACRTHMFAVGLLVHRLKTAGLDDKTISKYSTKMMSDSNVAKIMSEILQKIKHTCAAPNALAISEFNLLKKTAVLFDLTLKNYGADAAKEVWAIAAHGRYDLIPNLQS